MAFNNIYHWLLRSKRRKAVVSGLIQPSTVKQIASKASISLDACSRVLWELMLHAIIQCLNPEARRSRLYWLTSLGIRCQSRLRKSRGLHEAKHNVPDIDWKLYGWICFNHRAAIIKSLVNAMQPASIKRLILQRYPDVKISANNVRDIIQLFLINGIVRPVHVKRKAHLHYELTETGKTMQRLISQAEGQYV